MPGAVNYRDHTRFSGNLPDARNLLTTSLSKRAY
jgi:hypothetical protein